MITKFLYQDMCTYNSQLKKIYVFPPVDKTGDFAILSYRRFKNKTSVKIDIKYKFKSRN